VLKAGIFPQTAPTVLEGLFKVRPSIKYVDIRRATSHVVVNIWQVGYAAYMVDKTYNILLGIPS
jgi:hypothetical protein